MSLPQHIALGYGGTLHVDLRDMASNVQLTVIKGDGTTAFGPVAATVSTVDTTLNSDVTRGGYQINVANATGMANAVKCWVGDDPEEVLIESLSGQVVALRRPLTRDHAANAAVQCTRVSYTVPAASANAAFWDGRMELNIDGGSSFVSTSVECTKYPIARHATVQNLFDEQSSLYHQSMREQDWERALDRGLEEVLKRIAKADPDLRARVYPAAQEIIDATVYATLMAFYRRSGADDATALYERYRKELQAEIENFCGTTPGDRNQDGVVSADERVTPRTVRLFRS